VSGQTQVTTCQEKKERQNKCVFHRFGGEEKEKFRKTVLAETSVLYRELVFFQERQEPRKRMCKGCGQNYLQAWVVCAK